MPRVYVVTPTYNEKDNLPILAERIFALKIPDLHLVIVDDNSPDGTGRIADELRQKYPITVINREKKTGLGKAYVQAFQSLPPEAEIVIQMDADLSHDPSVIPAMLEKIKNCDVVLGSRYIPGGKIENWDFGRQLISKFGNLYARLVLGLPYHDLTGGFKCWRKDFLKKMNLEKLSSVGYNFQIETTNLAHKLGAKICEVPITFTERKTGASKFNLGIILESFWKVFLLRFHKF